MLEPQGPLPEEIYKRRRIVAIVGAVVVLVVVILLIATQCGGPDAPAENAADTSSAQAAATTEKSTPVTSTPTTSGAPSTTPAEDKTQAAEAEAAAVAQGQCPDSAIGITVAPERPNYAVGDQPKFITTITNIGNVPCSRDLSDALTPNVVATLDGSTKLWTSTDCFPGGEARVVTLEPGKQERSQIQWSGTTSNAGCGNAERTQVGPGAYTVTAFSAGKASAPETFNIG